MLDLPATIHIGDIRSTGGDYVSIEVGDEDAGVRIIEVHLSHEQYGRLVAGCGFVHCTASVNDSGLVGMQSEHKTELVPCEHVSRDADKAAILAPFEVDGWKGNESDLGNHHCWKGSGYRVVFHRWVPKKEADDDA